MARCLLMPHAPTGGLAHMGACMEVGKRLREGGLEVEMAYGGTRPEVAAREGFGIHRVLEVAADREWSADGWFASTAELRSCVDSHLRVIERWRPDVAVSSSGIAGRLACEMAGVPQLHLMHYLPGTRYGRRAIVWGDRLRDAGRPRRVARVLRARARRRSKAAGTVAVVDAVRRELGLPQAGSDTFAGARDPAVAITSAPFVDPARSLPGHWHYVGPLAWSAQAVADEQPIERGDHPLVYVTQGSTGDPGLLRRTVAELAGEDVDLLVATGGLCDPAEIIGLGPHVRAADLLPGRACLEAADAAVIHGGHLTFSEAVCTGTPVIVLPYRSDQIARVNRAERLGVGVAVWPLPRRHGAIRRAVRRVLAEPGYASRGARLAERLRDWDGAGNAARLAERLVA